MQYLMQRFIKALTVFWNIAMPCIEALRRGQKIKRHQDMKENRKNDWR
jgi:hypothetical protein